MARKPPTWFSAQSFLTQPGPGKRFKSWPPKHIVFAQGDKADAVYYLHDDKVKLAVLSAQGKEAVVGVLVAQQFLASTVSPAKRSERRQQRSLKEGDILYWYETKSRRMLWKSQVTRVDRIFYSAPDSLRQQLKSLFGPYNEVTPANRLTPKRTDGVN